MIITTIIAIKLKEYLENYSEDATHILISNKDIEELGQAFSDYLDVNLHESIQQIKEGQCEYLGKKIIYTTGCDHVKVGNLK